MLNLESSLPAEKVERRSARRPPAFPRWLPVALRAWPRFPRLLARVSARGERETLVHRGQVVAALVPIAELERLEELDRRAAEAETG